MQAQMESSFVVLWSCMATPVCMNLSALLSAVQLSKMLPAQMRHLMINWQVFSSFQNTGSPLEMN